MTSTSPSPSASSHRTPSIPNQRGTKAVYALSDASNGQLTHEIRVLDLQSNTSTTFSSDPHDHEASWLGDEDGLIWLRDVRQDNTEIWIGDAKDLFHAQSYCAGQIGAKARHLKVKTLNNEYDDIAIVVSAPVTESGNLAELNGSRPSSEIVQNSLWFSTLRKKPVTENETRTRYMVSPPKFINALRGTGLASPPLDSTNGLKDFDLSASGLVFLSRENPGSSPVYACSNAYYIPLKTFRELSRPRAQIISVRDHEGSSSCPVFSPKGLALAFLKKKHPIDQNDRNRVVVINNIREFRYNSSLEDARTQESEKAWHLSPFSLAWSDDGNELYVVAVDQGIRKLFKIPAAVSTIRSEPEPITSESKTPADVRHMRMVFSAPMG